MSKNTYMDLFGNQEICLIFVEIKPNKIMEKYEKEIKWFWIGFSIGAIVGIIILDLVQRGLI